MFVVFFGGGKRNTKNLEDRRVWIPVRGNVLDRRSGSFSFLDCMSIFHGFGKTKKRKKMGGSKRRFANLQFSSFLCQKNLNIFLKTIF